VRRLFYPGVTPVFILITLFSFAAAEGLAQKYSLELVEAKGSATQTSIIVEGQVKNITTKDLSGITVYCNFRGAGGKIVRTEESTLETDPLPPNKESEFKCSTKASPEIKDYAFRFVSLFGGELTVAPRKK